MRDALGKVTHNQLMKNMKQNEMFQELKKAFRDMNHILEKAYILDDKICISTVKTSEEAGDYHFNKLKEDGRHASVRYCPGRADLSGGTIYDAQRYSARLAKEQEFYKWLVSLDYSDLYTVYEKGDEVLDAGSFTFSTDRYPAEPVKKVIDYLRGLYKVGPIYGHGYNSGTRVIIVTDDLEDKKNYFAPKRFDLHVFDKDMNHVRTIRKIFEMDIQGPASWYMDSVLSDDGSEVAIAIRSERTRTVHSYDEDDEDDEDFTADDTYYAYASIKVGDGKTRPSLDIHPFVYHDTSSGGGRPDSEGSRDYGTVKFVVTNRCGVSHREAIKLSKAM